MERVDLYKVVHKGIRRVLGALVDRAGRTDFASEEERHELAAAMRDVHAMLESHAHHEDEFVMPLVRRVAPEVATKLDAEHGDHGPRLEALIDEVEHHGTVSSSVTTDVAVSLSRLVAEIGLHMADEEELAQPILWRTNDDVALGAVHQALVSSIPPETMARFLTEMLPAMNAPERATFLSRMSEGAPVEAVRGVIELARNVLSPEELHRLARDAGAAFARAA